ncbi:hypothetical protein FRC01_008293 [Tulasnella sp. 417]|nr:hypothetical protein FRC01_008293 [Tulasnella sp. 417]
MSSIMSSPQPSLAPLRPQIESNQQTQPGAGPPPDRVDVRTIIIAGGAVGGIAILLAVCTVWRTRMVRRRRIALGLPPVEARVRRRRVDSEDEDDKPVFYDAWVEFGLGADGERPRWDQIQALSSIHVSSQPVPPHAEEMEDPFKNYFSSILELVSVERMDRAILKTVSKNRSVEYAKSELVTSVMIAMPRPRQSKVANDQSLPELEFGIHEGPCPREHLKEI